jgi:hypothetical protein
MARALAIEDLRFEVLGADLLLRGRPVFRKHR